MLVWAMIVARRSPFPFFWSILFHFALASILSLDGARACSPTIPSVTPF